MIRRKTQSGWILIRQHDHGKLAGELAGKIGGKFTRPEPGTLEAIGLHDIGWGADEAPTLDDQHEPRHFLNNPVMHGVHVWEQSAVLAEQHSAYAGLLAGLHAFSLSKVHEKNRGNLTPQQALALNKYHQGQIERHEALRAKLGFPTDIPLTWGLAERGANAMDDQLRDDLLALQAMDALSLDICADDELFHNVGQLPLISFAGVITNKALNAHRLDDNKFTVTLWPFQPKSIDVDVPAWFIQPHQFENDDALQQAWENRQAVKLTLRLEALPR